ncbi:MAG: penicillin acylase family protein [Gemmatimonadetes bacterium]|nr:penicillin acylase family protein [Gemmatimonadota bacterium]
MLKALAFSVLTAAALWLSLVGAGPIPPLGPLLNPRVGLWANAADDGMRQRGVSGVLTTDSVVVRFDQRGVPHIFARNELDAFRALGFVVARDRLFQLELQARAGEGTLTELVGDVALSADQETRHLGMPHSAEQRWAAMDTTSRMARVLQAYADGINAYRELLTPADYPVEYKLLRATPRPWVPIHSLHLLNRMGYTLAHDPVELNLLRARALVGDSAARVLFDSDSPVQDPIQPAARNAPREALGAIPAPGAPDPAATKLVAQLTRGARTGPLAWSRDAQLPADEREALQQLRAFASNNWAVAPSRSASGHALLAGDPHLELTLPSIWYEVHLVVPGVMDVGGVTIPGLPGVTIGYTRAFAWSFTNTGADVMDFWQETVDNAAAPTAYELDGSLQKLVTRVETYRDARGRTLATDTVYYTHRGPMRRQGSTWLSMRWTVLEAGTELQGFYASMHATTAQAFLDSLAAYYTAPAQNMIVADTAGTIAIRSTGRFPIRADSGRGTAILDGRTRRSDWIGFRPVSRYPQALRPAQGFLASANQQPIDPESDPLYLGVDNHYEIWRALQVNRLLRADSAVTVDKMRRMHTDPGSVRAERLVPALLEAARARAGQGTPPASLGKAIALLAAWDMRYTRENTGARLFETALGRVTTQLYDEFIPTGDSTRAVTPSESRLLQFFAQPANAWWDDRRTAEVREDRDRIVGDALAWAYDTLVVQYGDPAQTPWTWGRVSPARPQHLLRLAGFSAPETPIDGGRGTLNPSVASRRANFGASWRMVVELGPQPIVRATYPGGQSGNPASPFYLDRLPLWASGTLDSVRTPRTPDELAPADVRNTFTFAPRPAATGAAK